MPERAATRTLLLLAAAVAHDLLIAPVATIDEVVASPQLAARGFVVRRVEFAR